MTRLESRILVTWTRLMSRWDKWWLDSSHVFHRMNRLESQSMTEDSSQSHFYKISEFLMNKPSSFAQKKWAFFASVMIKIGANFLFCLSGHAILHFNEQVSPTCTEEDLTLCFHWGVSRAQYIDTLSWFNVVFACHDHAGGPHTVTLSLLQIPAKWFKFFRFKSKPKTIVLFQNKMPRRKPNLV